MEVYRTLYIVPEGIVLRLYTRTSATLFESCRVCEDILQIHSYIFV